MKKEAIRINTDDVLDMTDLAELFENGFQEESVDLLRVIYIVV